METKLFTFVPDGEDIQSVFGFARQAIRKIENSGGSVEGIQFIPTEKGCKCAILARVAKNPELERILDFLGFES